MKKEKVVDVVGRFEIAPVRNESENGRQQMIEEEIQKKENYTSCRLPQQQQGTLMPITDYEYNVREMIKNCILLEDHLVHPEKRCNDCCVKHFLFLEALAEEARTLDKENQMSQDLRSLPDFFRDCQKQYHTLSQQPGASDADYQNIAQQLRGFRKQHQQQYFAVLWDNNSTGGGGCTNGLCPNV